MSYWMKKKMIMYSQVWQTNNFYIFRGLQNVAYGRPISNNLIGSWYTRPFCSSFDLLSSQEKFYYSQLNPNLYISKCITFDYLQWIVVIPPSNVTKEQEYIFAESIFKEWLLKSFQGRLHYSVIVFPISFSSKNSSCKHFQGLWIKASFNSILSFKKGDSHLCKGSETNSMEVSCW